MRKSANIIRAMMVSIVILSFLLAGCGGAAEEGESEAASSDSLIDEISRRGVLKVGFDVFVPWAFRDKDGELAGFEIDVATKLAEDMGVEVEFIPTEWAGIIPALLTGKFDVIIGGMGTTPERALKVNFSIPYEVFGNDVVVHQEMLPGVTSLQELNNEDVIIAVRMGATPAETARRLLPNAQLHQFDSDEAVIQDVLNRNAHAAISSSPTPAFWAADYPDVLYRPLDGELITFEPCGFAVRKGDHDAVRYFDTWIRYNHDWLEERFDYWYGSRDWVHLLGDE